jgi:membrane protease YdiL (CAAX protease family)
MAVWTYGVGLLLAAGIAAATGRLGTLLGDRAPDAKGLGLGVAVAAAIVVVSRVLDALLPIARRAGEDLYEILGPLGPGEIVFLAVASGVVEETLFRGAVQPLLGLWWTTAVFAVAHTVPKKGLVVFLPVFAAVAGLAMGWLREETGGVAAPALAHALVNGTNLAWLQGRGRRLRGTAPSA